MFHRRVRFAQNVAELTLQAGKFLSSNGFPNTVEYRKLFGAFIQHLPGHQDWFNPARVAAMLRKARANEAAFWMMNPDRWEAEQKKLKELDDTKTARSTSSQVV